MKYRNIMAAGLAMVWLWSSCSSVERLIGNGKDKLPGHKTQASVFSPDLGMTENIGEPLSGKTAVNLRKKVASDVRMIQKLKGTYVSAVREGEVIEITLPASVLFEPNDSVLWERAASTLRPLLRYADPTLYGRVIVAGYMDDTGSPAYTQHLSAIRADVIARWFQEKGAPGLQVVTYAFGSESPLFPNVSEVNRSRNRRIVLYLVPGTEMLNKARRGKFG